MSEGGAGRHVRPGDSGQGGQSGDVVREAVLARAFVRLADTLASDFDVVDFLHGLSADSVEILRAEAAGVMLADPRGRLRLIASSDERMRLLEPFELQDEQGPCLDAFSFGRAVQASAADSRARWPVFAARACGEGFQVMCAVPLRVRAHVIGALNLFRGSDEPFTGTEMEIAQAMAEMAAIGLIQERALRERNLLTEQLQAALNSRVVIEQAKGMLAEYLNITVDDAFKLLRNHARDHTRKLSEVAADVVDRKIPGTALARRPSQENSRAKDPGGTAG
jgi:GAF domain-containing protein